MRLFSFSIVIAAAALAGCANLPAPDAARVPHASHAPNAPAISIVNSLSFDHAMSNKRDGLRSAWPMEKLAGTTEHFPLAQLKQCDSAGACKWGVLDAKRRFGAVRATPDGVTLEVEITVNVDRSQQADRTGLNAAMTIPAGVAVLQVKRTEKRDVVLPFGKVVRIDLDHGVRYELCALRLDAARQSVDKCDVAYF